MAYDFELEDILDSVKEKKSESGENNAREPLAPPKPKTQGNGEISGSSFLHDNDIEKLNSGKKLSENKDEIKDGKKSASKFKDKKDKVKLSFEPPEFLVKAVKSFKTPDKKTNRKRLAILICSCVAALALIAVIAGVIHYNTGGYVEKFEKEYGVEYPEGMLREFREYYGKDQSFSGTITIKDTKTDEVPVYSKAKKGSALLDKGSDVKTEQHIRAISIDKSLADIESVYKNSKGFVNASQKVTFKTLFEEEDYRVVAAYYTNTKPEDDNGYVFPYNAYGNLTSGSFFQYQDRVKTKSLYNTGYKLKRENYILSVSVPSNFMPNYRFVITCVKVDGNFDKIKKTTANNNIYYPQSWYTKNKKNNPYYLARGWYPEIKIGTGGETKKLTQSDFQFN